MPLAKAHGAAVIALTIDEVGMAQDAPSASSRSRGASTTWWSTEYGLAPEPLIFDALTFTLATGDEEWRPSAVETIEGIRLHQGGAAGRAHVARRLERVVRRLAAPRARC